MIRRIIMVAAAAVALVLTPSVAMAFTAPMAYNAPGYTCTVSDSTPKAGAPVTLVCIGAVPNSVLTLTITRNPAANFSPRVLDATADANGSVTFTFTLAPAGTYEFVVKGANGAVVSTQTVKVLGVVADAAPIKVGQLPRTGFDPTGLLVGGGLLVFAGAGAVVVAKRRKSAQVSA